MPGLFSDFLYLLILHDDVPGYAIAAHSKFLFMVTPEPPRKPGIDFHRRAASTSQDDGCARRPSEIRCGYGFVILHLMEQRSINSTAFLCACPYV
jgi:hypothetical protein